MIRILVPLFACALLSGCANRVSQPTASLALVSAAEVSSSSMLDTEASAAINRLAPNEEVMIAQIPYTLTRSYFAASGTICRQAVNTRGKGAAKVLCKAANTEHWYWIPSILAVAEPTGESQ